MGGGEQGSEGRMVNDRNAQCGIGYGNRVSGTAGNSAASGRTFPGLARSAADMQYLDFVFFDPEQNPARSLSV